MNIDINKCRPFDGTKCKAGDVVVHQFGSLGRFIAHVEDSSPEYACVIKWNDSALVDLYSTDGKSCQSSLPSVFLPPIDPLDEIDPSPGNVAKLTRWQVGDGWRIPEHGEEPNRNAEVFSEGEWRKNSNPSNGLPYDEEFTYRVPITPTMVPLGPDDIILGKTLVRVASVLDRTFLVCQVDALGVVLVGLGLRTWKQLWESWEISFDHGTTWQRAQKQEVKK